jgi:hypothetical protein
LFSARWVQTATCPLQITIPLHMLDLQHEDSLKLCGAQRIPGCSRRRRLMKLALQSGGGDPDPAPFRSKRRPEFRFLTTT